METENKYENSTQTNESAPDSNATAKRSRPPQGLFFFAFSLLAMIVAMKIVSCTAFSKIDVMEEIQKSNNAPQVKIINN